MKRFMIESPVPTQRKANLQDMYGRFAEMSASHQELQDKISKAESQLRSAEEQMEQTQQEVEVVKARSPKLQVPVEAQALPTSSLSPRPSPRTSTPNTPNYQRSLSRPSPLEVRRSEDEDSIYRINTPSRNTYKTPIKTKTPAKTPTKTPKSIIKAPNQTPSSLRSKTPKRVTISPVKKYTPVKTKRVSPVKRSKNSIKKNASAASTTPRKASPRKTIDSAASYLDMSLPSPVSSPERHITRRVIEQIKPSPARVSSKSAKALPMSPSLWVSIWVKKKVKEVEFRQSRLPTMSP